MSLASAYGSLQLKHQNWRWVVARRRCLNSLTISCKCSTQMQSQLPGGTKSTCIITSLVFHWGQPDSGESCTVIESRPAQSLVTKLPRCAVHKFSIAIEQAKAINRYVQLLAARCQCLKGIRLITALYMRSSDLFLIHCGRYIEDVKNKHKIIEIEGWVLA